MNKEKLIYLIFAFLILSNIVILIFLFKEHNHDRQFKNGPKEIIIKKLDFNEKQIKKFEEIIKIQREQVNLKELELKEQKNLLFIQLKNETDSQRIKEILNNISRIYIEIQMIFFEHFVNIKEICNENQLVKFNDLADELNNIFFGKKPPPPNNHPPHFPPPPPPNNQPPPIPPPNSPPPVNEN